ncbi:hypothetical protein THMIRHAS_00090 [Thiosulfatimonas sediminis]|uniref:Outer membrane protein beta-barrel domain-containing protein n=1 Tax=Thiosulfatimonas sediminis TaxID=2675054 RepID=A0A6F8PRC7_9GAMM|nr:hypothetical protein [Thiosulfatimonas sediminis]BBP44636.1 hypothetical protein THMIRHAS_00090 [Thiosulfatimonas sediminis]
MKKILALTAMAASILAVSNSYAQTQPFGQVGVAVGVDLISGPTLELSYPVTDYVSLRGSLSTGWSFDKTQEEEGIDYNLQVDGAINRLAVDVRPFKGSFFLSAGYGLSSFSLSGSGSVEQGNQFDLGDTSYTADTPVNIRSDFDWDSAPTLSFGWGHSPSQGLGFLFEMGAAFTGASNVSLNGTGTVTDGSNTFSLDSTQGQEVLAEEEAKLQADVSDLEFLPIVRMAVTYRF